MTFEEFAVSQLPAVLRFAAVLTGDRASAEDIVQEILIRAHRNWNQISGLDRPERYVRGLDQLRHVVTSAEWNSALSENNTRNGLT